MKGRIFTLLIIGMVFAPICYSAEEPNRSASEDGNDVGMYVEFFNIDDDGRWHLVDFGNISAYVIGVIRNVPGDADKVFVYLDEVQIDDWLRGFGITHGMFGFESSKFSNGRHKIKLTSVNSDGEAKNYPPINSNFNNLLYCTRYDDFFHPTRDYHYSGFYDGLESIEAEVTDLYENVIWSNKYSGNCIEITIPGSVFEKEKSCDLNITNGFSALSESLSREFRKEEFGIDVNEVNGCTKETDPAIAESNEVTARSMASYLREQEFIKSRQLGECIEFFQAGKYFAPPAEKTVAIMLYPPYGEVNGYEPRVLIGDKKLAEKLMGKSLEPEIVVEDHDWVVKIIDAYRTALKEAQERKFRRYNYIPAGQIIFVTMEEGYIQQIYVDENTIHNNYMESRELKEYFDEICSMGTPSSGELNEAEPVEDAEK